MQPESPRLWREAFAPDGTRYFWDVVTYRTAWQLPPSGILRVQPVLQPPPHVVPPARDVTRTLRADAPSFQPERAQSLPPSVVCVPVRPPVSGPPCSSAAASSHAMAPTCAPRPSTNKIPPFETAHVASAPSCGSARQGRVHDRFCADEKVRRRTSGTSLGSYADTGRPTNLR